MILYLICVVAAMLERGREMQRRSAAPKDLIIEQCMHPHPRLARKRIWKKSKPEEEQLE